MAVRRLRRTTAADDINDVTQLVDTRTVRTTKRSDERGSTLVEAALVLPFVIFVILLTIEAGWFMQTYLTVEHVTGETARELAVSATAEDGDWRALQVGDSQLGANERTVLSRLVIFDASVNDEPTSACKNGPPPGSSAEGCSIYTMADLGEPPSGLTCGWCHDKRQVGDSIGVWTEFQYRSVTGMFGDQSVVDVVSIVIEG